MTPLEMIVVNAWQSVVAGAAGIIAIMSVIGAYNQWKLRSLMEEYLRRNQ